MKRALGFVLVLAMLFVIAAPTFAYDREEAEYILSTISENVDATVSIINAVNEIIDWQVTTSRADCEAYKAAIAKGETYESEDTDEENKQKYDEMAGYISTVSILKKQIDAIDPTGISQIDITIDAAKTYFAWVQAALNDLMSIFDFFYAEEEAFLPLTDIDEDAYSDDMTYIEDMYIAFEDVTENMKAIQCPQFMQNTFNAYIRQVNIYCSILESYYYAYSLNDMLRLSSAINLSGRMNITIAKYEIALTEQFNLQYEKVGERFAGRIGTLQKELINNCEALLNAI